MKRNVSFKGRIKQAMASVLIAASTVGIPAAATIATSPVTAEARGVTKHSHRHYWLCYRSRNHRPYITYYFRCNRCGKTKAIGQYIGYAE